MYIKQKALPPPTPFEARYRCHPSLHKTPPTKLHQQPLHTHECKCSSHPPRRTNRHESNQGPFPRTYYSARSIQNRNSGEVVERSTYARKDCSWRRGGRHVKGRRIIDVSQSRGLAGHFPVVQQLLLLWNPFMRGGDGEAMRWNGARNPDEFIRARWR